MTIYIHKFIENLIATDDKNIWFLKTVRQNTGVFLRNQYNTIQDKDLSTSNVLCFARETQLKNDYEDIIYRIII